MELLKSIIFVLCVGMILTGFGVSIYSEFAAAPENVRSRWSIEWYWFIHFWYVWVLMVVAFFGAAFSKPKWI